MVKALWFSRMTHPKGIIDFIIVVRRCVLCVPFLSTAFVLTWRWNSVHVAQRYCQSFTKTIIILSKETPFSHLKKPLALSQFCKTYFKSLFLETLSLMFWCQTQYANEFGKFPGSDKLLMWGNHQGRILNRILKGKNSLLALPKKVYLYFTYSLKHTMSEKKLCYVSEKNKQKWNTPYN